SLEGSITRAPVEGALLPEPYIFNRGMPRDELIARMERDHQEVLDELWARRVPNLPIATKEEAVILASIVEKETGVASERPLVAGVFINRLRKGMKLQSDPTIIYGLTKGVPLGRGIRKSEIEKATPYNTYVINGLPPTPIANPGRESIAAVLNPATTDALFFVADGTGGHVFAATLAEHERNVANWRQVERQRAAEAAAAEGQKAVP
ncbi:MAG: endolytic transglycosylase MltG, partial [Alphaproteobacteria bacterium]